MPRTLRQRTEAALFDGTLAFVASLARLGLRRPTASFLGGVAAVVRRYRRARTDERGAAALGREWQRLMPNPKVMPITHVEDDTAYGEIRVHCPLRGTGDVKACHALMAYDRALLEPAGGRFVVLQSQAEPGVTHCRVAIRPAHLPADDLVHAHVRVESLARRKGAAARV